MRVNLAQIILKQAMLFGVFAYIGILGTPILLAYEEETVATSEETTAPMEEGIIGNEEVGKSQDTSLGLGNFSITPVVANEKAKPRDIIKKELIVTNNTGQRVDLYITVENVDPNEGVKEFISPGAADLSVSLANWVEITRGVIELGPNESRKIPFLIHVNLSAKPGSYYARIQFREGAKRNEAEVGREGSALMLNVEVSDNAKERLQLGNFMSNSSVIFGTTVSFSYLLENVGNRLIEPRGSIRIFNRRGEEVGSIPLNANGEEISPENKRQLASAWSATGRFGKYKAFLDLEYGEEQLASVQDTVYFWVFPWKEIVTALFGVIILAVVGTYVIHMRAIAQPARVRRSMEERQETVRGYNAPQGFAPRPVCAMQTQQRTTAQQPSRQASPTHVHIDQEGVRKLPEIQSTHSTRHGTTVTLASRGTKGNTKTHGNVIQLSPRN